MIIMSDSAFRWGIIGPGRIAHRFAEAMDVVEGSVVAAVASSAIERAQAFADQHKIETVYNDYSKLASDSSIDAIYIATPHRFHAEQAIICLDNKKSVLCEKPLTVSFSEAQRLVDSAQRNQCFLMEALWTRFLPIYQQVKEWLKNEEIGQVLHLSSSFGFRFPYDLKDRIYNEALAGGILLDGCVYNLSMTQWILKELTPSAVQATGYIGETGVDESLMVNLNYSHGRTSQLMGSIKSTLENAFTIYGTEGSIRVAPMFWDTTSAQLKNHRGELVVTKPFDKNGFEYQIREVKACVEKGSIESVVMPHQETLETMKIMDNIRQQIGLKYSFE